MRTLANRTYYGGDDRTYVPYLRAFPYHRYYDFDIRYSLRWNGVTVGGEVLGGMSMGPGLRGCYQGVRPESLYKIWSLAVSISRHLP